MKKLCSALFLLALVRLASAQPYGNEWIDYGKTYYKFKIVKDGLYRIPYSVLLSTGVGAPAIRGTDFKLFHNGEEVPLYVTTNGVYGASDYVEFYGRKNDGKPDTKLYRDPGHQPNDRLSMFADTSVYFLTFDPFTINLRMQQQTNDVTNPPAPQTYCRRSHFIEFGSLFNGDFASPYFQQLYNSDFDKGEGFASGNIQGGANYLFDLNGIYYAPGLTARLRVNYIGGITEHVVRFNIGNYTFTDSFSGFNVRKLDKTLDVNLLNNGGQPFLGIQPQVQNEQNFVSVLEMNYPRNFNFSGFSKIDFALETGGEAYLEIRNFNARSTVPILYDLQNNRRYSGVTDTVLKFRLASSILPKGSLYLSSQDASDIITVSGLSAVTFRNFQDILKQGNYVIISHRNLTKSNFGIDYLDEYAKYRQSVPGGSYKPFVYYIDELNDQFAYGINTHPLAIRNFINFALDKFSVKPTQVFLIGKGYAYVDMLGTSALRNKNFVQTYGNPASDNLLVARSATSNTPQVGVGRLAAQRGDDIKIYLDKVKEYEANLNDTSATSEIPEKKLWMKNVLHLGGGNNNFEQQLFRSYLDNYKTIIEAPQFGGKVSSLFKNSTDPIQIAQNLFLDSLINAGVSLISFFGHSATTTLDFNLIPESYNNRGRYHLMLTNGCFVGSIFNDFFSYSERFVLTPNKAAIGFIAPITYAVSSNLSNYSYKFYNYYSDEMYNSPIGNVLKAASTDMIGTPSTPIDPMIGEQMIYHGDPALRINTHYRPDYYIDASSILFEPANLNAAADSFLVRVVVKNLAAASASFYTVNIDRIFPNGEIQSYKVDVPSARYIDTVDIWVKSDRLKGPGTNTFRIKVDYDEEIAEYVETNNEVTITKLISADDVIPIFPYEFGIVNDPAFEMIFSTADYLAGTRQYIFEVDTTELFNSPMLVRERVTAPGSVIRWKPAMALLQNKVYYWRGSLDTIYGNQLNWNKSSYIYNTNLGPGWNQSHYFQYLNDKFSTLALPQNRIWKYPNTVRTIQIRNGIIPDQQIEAYFDGYLIARNAWARKGFIFFVYDVNTGQNWQTFQIGRTCTGPYGDITCNLYPVNVIEFITNDNSQAAGAAYRQKVIDFINSIPCNAYVLGYSFYNAGYNQWPADQNILGQTLYDAFEDLGVSQIRNVQENQPFVFFLQKCNPAYTPIQLIRTIPQVIDTLFTFSGTWSVGSLQSTIIGPSTAWDGMHFDWHALEDPTDDFSTLNLYGFDTAGTRTLLIDQIPFLDNDISSIDAARFPLLQMEWNTRDDTLSTAPQLDFWRINYTLAPEAVVNPTIYFTTSRDSIISGEEFTLGVGVENVTPINMDSLLVKFTIITASNNITTLYKRYAPLPGKNSINIDFTYDFPGSVYFGMNTIVVEVNPDEDQVEQFHFNNFAEFRVFVDKDRVNPLLDVTFDGRHITDGEYVSNQPQILFRLRDENKFLALDDTSAFLIYMFYPNDPTNPVLLTKNQPDVTFIPADPSNLTRNNEARLIYAPTLPDGTYEIRAQGIDRSKNDAGRYDYRIKFVVDSKPSITNLLNYPNPFTTSTQFVFTVTGTEVPDNLRIQIFSASGKVVKEISREELGDLHIGTNITPYRWDGTDTYGDRLANGVYFYRVIVRNNDGTQIELKPTAADKFFKNGYGKMYLMR